VFKAIIDFALERENLREEIEGHLQGTDNSGIIANF